MSVADLVERVLPAGPDAVFARAHPMLTELLGEGAFALGGGSALAAVWQHRPQEREDVSVEHPDVVSRMLDKAIAFRALQPPDAVPPYDAGREGFVAPPDWKAPDLP